MSNIIDKIQLSGTNYDIQDSNATRVVEITQSDYDNLPSSAKTSNIIYIITDGSVNYITSAQCQTQINNSISGKQDTLVSGTNIKTINNESILGSGNITIQGGGGKAVVGGRGITVTSGENADTVSFNLPISAGTGTNSIKCGETDEASGGDSFAIGANGVRAKGQCSFAGGSYSQAKGFSSMAFGRYNIANNYGEVALGFFNISNGSSSAAGNSSDNTLFSVGNGTNQTSSTRHNAFEIRQNGDIYLNDGSKLQDTVSATAANTTALGGLKLVKLSQSEYDSLATKDNSTLYVIVN